ncbi:ABC transporter permease [Candidatus Thioglobus sp. NP1]|uniref:ABC transporter permease n=1 Tax=Candidatus Thioglobus sp. NP1 TaxID=2508687 RepID=UPI00035D39C5|nr:MULTISPECIES: ABC transporter permease [Gammaproteobacteria incertae sedis]AXE61635.1 polyamine ABC transporter substrate-binding protein [Candidatus Thioglobus sp. NP1]MDA8854586.1 ABC transporter permease [Candidatus Pseudothioglobus singularis]MDA9801575.1 ABC transporter permease [Candidatus Pseudothioglobus singularis]MDC0597655.1 ABC transporter permease [Candidatus Pseudothioglobus singularis]MDC0599406.1 ABC transporter permease [Candidatus Pseudothioglobus singularis]|tara:strand:+ start:44 stop:1438 length:1395 start_codon:yes stop_codon:yes gene_type:complete
MSDTSTINSQGQLLTNDGVPLKDSLRKSLRRTKIRSFLLILAPLSFLLFMFVAPIGSLLSRSIDDIKINEAFPQTFAQYEEWEDKSQLPSEEMFAAVINDIRTTIKIQDSEGNVIGKNLLGRSGTRMTYEYSGWKSLINKTVKEALKVDKKSKEEVKPFKWEAPFKEKMIKRDKRWAKVEFWQSLGPMKDPYTMGYYLNAVDLRYDANKNIVQKAEYLKIYNTIWLRTLKVSLMVTLFCLLLAYPVAYLLATLPMRTSNLLMICVLMPFWTSLLVRIVAWMIMLQQNGVVNDTLINILPCFEGMVNLPFFGATNIDLCFSDEDRIPMMYNFTGTIIVMTQVLLPFMILPIYSVMKGIPPSYMKAAQNLGATPTWAFIRVYMPQSVPGIGAGCILVFIVAIGYYITPELVGGKDGIMIGNFVAREMQRTLNWGLAAAMGAILLTAVLILYWAYDRLIGLDNLKMG